MANKEATRVKCKNGLTVRYGVVTTGKNFGYFTIEGGNAPERSVIVSTWELAETIGKMLIEDFGGRA
jgi:hypothetical protein